MTIKTDWPNLYSKLPQFFAVKIESQSHSSRPTHIAADKLDSPSLYRHITHFVAVKIKFGSQTDTTNIYRPPTRLAAVKPNWTNLYGILAHFVADNT